MIKATLKSKLLEDICVHVQLDNHKWTYLFDCGYASLLSHGECQKIKALFISHTHIDHFSNFDFVLRNQLGTGNTTTICGPPGIAKNVQGKLHGYLWNLIDRSSLSFLVREINPDNTIVTYELHPPEWELVKLDEYKDSVIYKDPDFSVNYTILDHNTPSVAYKMSQIDRLKIGEFPFRQGAWISKLKNAYQANDSNLQIDVHGEIFTSGELFQYLYIEKGSSVAYVMDHLGSTENHEKIIDLVGGVDELFIESYYRDVDLEYAKLNHHSTARISGEVARKANVKKLSLVHHSRRYNTEVQDLWEEGRAAFEGREPVFLKPPVSRY